MKNIYPIYKVEDNPYGFIYIDVTYQCNMGCNVCYNKKLRDEKSDYYITPEYLKEVCERLPRQSQIRFLGGEPTVHPKLGELIKIVYETGHILAICTNGIKLNDKKFIKEIKTWNTPGIKHRWYGNSEYPWAWSFDLSGGTTHNKYYKKIHGFNHLDMKMKAIQNAIDTGIGSIGTNATIIRGVNESVIPELLENMFATPQIHTVHFRNMTQVGDWLSHKPYSMEELKKVVQSYIPDMYSYPTIRNGVECNRNECYGCCYRFRMKGKLVCIIEFASDTSAKCWDRGWIDDNFNVTSFFGQMLNLEK